MERALLTVEELANRWSVTRETVHAWTITRGLPCIRLSDRIVRFDPAAVELWLAARQKTDGAHRGGEPPPKGSRTHAELVEHVRALSVEVGRDLLAGRRPEAVPLAELREIVAQAARKAVRPSTPPLRTTELLALLREEGFSGGDEALRVAMEANPNLEPRRSLVGNHLWYPDTVADLKLALIRAGWGPKIDGQA